MRFTADFRAFVDGQCLSAALTLRPTVPEISRSDRDADAAVDMTFDINDRTGAKHVAVHGAVDINRGAGADQVAIDGASIVMVLPLT